MNKHLKHGNRGWFKKGDSPWNKGLTKHDDPRLRSHRKGKSMEEEYGKKRTFLPEYRIL